MRWYNALLQKYPLPTKATTSGILFSVGDALTQFIFQKKEFNVKRNVDFFLMGFGYIGTCLHVWYSRLLPALGNTFIKSQSKTIQVFGRMLFDQLLFAPILLTGFFPINQIIIDRDIKSFGKGVQVWKQKIQETLFANWKIWPIASTVNFWFMPIKYQVLFANFVGLFWNMILSFIASK